METKTFLSHNSLDKPMVEQIGRWLEDKAGLPVWLDKWNLIPGDPWQEEIEKALDESQCCVVFLGPNGIGPWQNEEMRSAIESRVSEKSMRVIPALLPGAMRTVKKNKLPRFLRRLTWVDFKDGCDDPGALHQLECGIRGDIPGRPDLEGKETIPLFPFFYRNFYPSAVFKGKQFLLVLLFALILAFFGGALYNIIFGGLLGGTGREPHGKAALIWPFFTMGPLLVVYLVYINYNYRMKITERLEQFFTSILFLSGLTSGAWFYYDFPFNKYSGFRQYIESRQMSFFLQETILVLLWTLSISFFGYLFVTIKNLRTFPNRKKSYLYLYLRQIALGVLPTGIGVIIILGTLVDHPPQSTELLRGVFAGISIRISLFLAFVLDLDMSIKNGDIANNPFYC